MNGLWEFLITYDLGLAGVVLTAWVVGKVKITRK